MSDKQYTWQEVGKHNTDSDMWIVINDNVYDVSKYMALHPGGPIVLLNRAGKSASLAFEQAAHSLNARTKILPEQCIGKIAADSVMEEWQREAPPSNLSVIATVAVLLLVCIVIYYLAA